MAMPPNELEFLPLSVFAPHFTSPVVNAIADSDLDYLRHELRRRLFAIHELPGDEMRDAHGVRLAFSRAFEEGHAPRPGDALLPRLDDILPRRAERRVAIIIRDADRFIEADVQRCLTLCHMLEQQAGSLRSAIPATQLAVFLAGPEPAFSAVDPAARLRAAASRGEKVMPGEVACGAWSQPREFDLGPRHRLTFSFAQWYYASRGRRAGQQSADRWHCVETGDVLTFIRAEDAQPCLAGTFARTAEGMQLVGIRYEGDESLLRLAAISEDPFTLFRQLCETLLHPVH